MPVIVSDYPCHVGGSHAEGDIFSLLAAWTEFTGTTTTPFFILLLFLHLVTDGYFTMDGKREMKKHVARCM